MLQNRTSARAAIPNNQQVFNAYGRYPMLVAAPGQVITMTWPRTAPPDGMAADGSEFLNVYYNPNATINAGRPVVLLCLHPQTHTRPQTHMSMLHCAIVNVVHNFVGIRKWLLTILQ